MSLGVGKRALREPSWPDIASGTPVAFGFQFPRMAYASPDVSLTNTPQLGANEAVATPSTFDTKAGPDSPVDYINYSRESREPPESGITNSAKQSNTDSSKSKILQPTSLDFAFQPVEQDPQAVPMPLSQNQLPISSTPTLTAVPEQLISEIPASASASQSLRMVRPNFITLPEKPSTSGPTTASTATAYSRATSAYASSESTLVSAPVSSLQLPRPKIGEGLKILVIDDDMLTRRLMGRMLEVRFCSSRPGNRCMFFMFYPPPSAASGLRCRYSRRWTRRIRHPRSRKPWAFLDLSLNNENVRRPRYTRRLQCDGA